MPVMAVRPVSPPLDDTTNIDANKLNAATAAASTDNKVGAIDMSRSFETELDACTSIEEMSTKLDEIVASFWDGTTPPTRQQYEGGIIRTCNDWCDITDVLDGVRKVCMITLRHSAMSVDPSFEYSDNSMLARIRGKGLLVHSHSEEAHSHELELVNNSCLTDVHIVHATSAQLTRAKLLIKMHLEKAKFYLKLRLAEQPDVWLDTLEQNIRFGLLLGYSAADVMFFVHRIRHPTGCLATTAAECKHV
jgi:hypothetical protein